MKYYYFYNKLMQVSSTLYKMCLKLLWVGYNDQVDCYILYKRPKFPRASEKDWEKDLSEALQVPPELPEQGIEEL